MDKIFDNNKVSLCGEIVSGFNYSHDVFGEGFYLFDLKVNRLSDTADVIPVMVSERLIDVSNNIVGQYVDIKGQYRSFNKPVDNKTKLALSVFAREISFKESVTDKNDIVIDGYVCKQPIYRETPLGREITDVLLAVNRPYGKSDYIPCIVWGRNARFAEGLSVGTCVEIFGRIQSREYRKQISENEFETRTAYEVSVSRIEEVEEIKDGN